jgi:SAM-dependent methyltransferase
LNESSPLADWLALREPLDAASRSFELTRAVAAALPRDRPLRIVDLGCGTGSNARYLEPHLRGSHDWLLVDADPSVLAAAPHHTRRLDLGRRDAPEIFAGRDLVTASALLDLVSEDFLVWLAEQCRAVGAVALFALTYTGRSRCMPSEPEDGVMCALLNLHQLQCDKGFGPAAGPGAVAYAENAFTAAGFHVRREPSNWHVEPEAIELQELLMQGWVDAALELAPFEADAIHDWHTRRLAHLRAGRSRIVVSHEDLAAFPPG